jgi:hypothetical protein
LFFSQAEAACLPRYWFGCGAPPPILAGSGHIRCQCNIRIAVQGLIFRQGPGAAEIIAARRLQQVFSSLGAGMAAPKPALDLVAGKE